MNVLLQMIATFLYSFISGIGAFTKAAFGFKPLYDSVGDIKDLAWSSLTGIPVQVISVIGAVFTLLSASMLIYRIIVDKR